MNPLPSTFPIVDSHVHFWNPRRFRYPWLPANPKLNQPFEPEQFNTHTAGINVDQLVFVEAGRAQTQNVLEAEWIGELARTDPRIRGIVAHATIERGVAVRPELDSLARLPLVKGVRRLLQDESDPGFCIEPVFVQGVKSLAKHRFSFDICVYHHQLGDVIQLVRRCPEITFILDHIGKPSIREAEFEPWQSRIRELAAFPNVWCKISGLATEADPERWQPTDLRPYIDHVIACFGFRRVMFGSDWPVATLATSYARWFETLRDAVSGVAEVDQRALFRENAIACYRL